MRHLFGSLFAIALAAVAAIAATSALLNSPARIGPTAENQAPPGQTPPTTPPTTKDSKPATPGPGPDGKAPASAPGGAAGDAADTEEGPDKDPYEGIAPEELPPDLQYNADSSVSFPTNI